MGPQWRFEKPLLKDGGIGTTLLPHKPAGLACVDLLNASDPQTVLAMHRSFLAAGARLLTSNTFCCDPDSLAATTFAGREAELCRLGAELARTAAGEQALVAGSLGPGWRFPSRGETSPAALQENYRLRAQGLLTGGADLLWIETVQDPLQAEAAVAGAQQALTELALTVPIAVLISLQTPTTLLGDQPLAQVLARLDALPVQILGVNCSQGPASVAAALDWLRRHSDKAIACCPNAGPGPEHYLTPAAYAAEMQVLAQGTTILGGCCGASPEHIQALRDLLLSPLRFDSAATQSGLRPSANDFSLPERSRREWVAKNFG
ncbi:MAG: homocysteine S-methyltransferase family protein [Candidatus Sericytochromatia bacterium]